MMEISLILKFGKERKSPIPELVNCVGIGVAVECVYTVLMVSKVSIIDIRILDITIRIYKYSIKESMHFKI
jgi:hypothetical protein